LYQWVAVQLREMHGSLLYSGWQHLQAQQRHKLCRNISY
jgi:hypothetical protein